MTQRSNPFFDELHEWSERKLVLLEKYLDGATKILGSTGQVFYVDGFAGRGSYGLSNESQVPGSPLRAAQLAQQFEGQRRAYSLRCINIEEDRETFDGLEAVTYKYGDIVTNLHGTFADNIDSVLSMVGTNPVICFLDPFGIEGMDMTAIQQLIRRGGKTDFWIRFEAGEARRRDGWFGKQEPGAERQFEILCRVYGIHDRQELHALLSGNTPEERKDKALRLYLQQLCREFAQARGDGFAAAYAIGSLDGESKYHLVFATASKKGLVLASNIVYGIEESYQKEVEWYRQEQRDGQLSMFVVLDPTESEIFDAKVAEIQVQVLSKYRGTSASRLDIHTHLLTEGNWFGAIKGSHLTKALKNMRSSTSVEASGPNSDEATVFTFSSR